MNASRRLHRRGRMGGGEVAMRIIRREVFIWLIAVAYSVYLLCMLYSYLKTIPAMHWEW